MTMENGKSKSWKQIGNSRTNNLIGRGGNNIVRFTLQLELQIFRFFSSRFKKTIWKNDKDELSVGAKRRTKLTERKTDIQKFQNKEKV